MFKILVIFSCHFLIILCHSESTIFHQTTNNNNINNRDKRTIFRNFFGDFMDAFRYQMEPAPPAHLPTEVVRKFAGLPDNYVYKYRPKKPKKSALIKHVVYTKPKMKNTNRHHRVLQHNYQILDPNEFQLQQHNQDFHDLKFQNHYQNLNTLQSQDPDQELLHIQNHIQNLNILESQNYDQNYLNNLHVLNHGQHSNNNNLQIIQNHGQNFNNYLPTQNYGQISDNLQSVKNRDQDLNFHNNLQLSNRGKNFNNLQFQNPDNLQILNSENLQIIEHLGENVYSQLSPELVPPRLSPPKRPLMELQNLETTIPWSLHALPPPVATKNPASVKNFNEWVLKPLPPPLEIPKQENFKTFQNSSSINKNKIPKKYYVKKSKKNQPEKTRTIVSEISIEPSIQIASFSKLEIDPRFNDKNNQVQNVQSENQIFRKRPVRSAVESKNPTKNRQSSDNDNDLPLWALHALHNASISPMDIRNHRFEFEEQSDLYANPTQHNVSNGASNSKNLKKGGSLNFGLHKIENSTQKPKESKILLSNQTLTSFPLTYRRLDKFPQERTASGSHVTRTQIRNPDYRIINKRPDFSKKSDRSDVQNVNRLAVHDEDSGVAIASSKSYKTIDRNKNSTKTQSTPKSNRHYGYYLGQSLSQDIQNLAPNPNNVRNNINNPNQDQDVKNSNNKLVRQYDRFGIRLKHQKRSEKSSCDKESESFDSTDRRPIYFSNRKNLRNPGYTMSYSVTTPNSVSYRTQSFSDDDQPTIQNYKQESDDDQIIPLCQKTKTVLKDPEFGPEDTKSINWALEANSQNNNFGFDENDEVQHYESNIRPRTLEPETTTLSPEKQTKSARFTKDKIQRTLIEISKDIQTTPMPFKLESIKSGILNPGNDPAILATPGNSVVPTANLNVPKNNRNFFTKNSNNENMNEVNITPKSPYKILSTTSSPEMKNIFQNYADNYFFLKDRDEYPPPLKEEPYYANYGSGEDHYDGIELSDEGPVDFYDQPNLPQHPDLGNFPNFNPPKNEKFYSTTSQPNSKLNGHYFSQKTPNFSQSIPLTPRNGNFYSSAYPASLPFNLSASNTDFSDMGKGDYHLEYFEPIVIDIEKENEKKASKLKQQQQQKISRTENPKAEASSRSDEISSHIEPLRLPDNLHESVDFLHNSFRPPPIFDLAVEPTETKNTSLSQSDVNQKLISSNK